MTKVVCYKEYKNFEKGHCYELLDITSDYNRNIKEMNLYEIGRSGKVGMVTSLVFYDYFIILNDSYSITLLKQVEIPNKITFFSCFRTKEAQKKYESVPFTYYINFSTCDFDKLYLLYFKLFSKIQLIKSMDKTLLYPFSNIIMANLDNLLEVIKLNNEELFITTIDNIEKVFNDMYDTCKNIYKKIEDINIQEQKEKENILLEKSNEITRISQEFFKDLNKLS